MMQWIVTSSLLIVAVILLRIIGRDRLSARVRYALWALVLIRLLVPFSIGESALSVMNLVAEENDSALVQQDPVLISDLPDTDVTIGTYDPSDTIVTNQTITATTPTVETETENPVGRALNILWFAGCAMSGAILLSCNLRLNAALKRSRKPVYVDGCPLPVYETAVVETPCMFGLVRPAVYIIPELTEDEAALRHVLAHELTHYRHLDHIWSFLRCLCLMLHWYNPLVWVAAYLSREDAELACDEGALKQIGDTERTAYGETLIALTCTGHSGLMTTATTMTGSKRSLTERIRRIANNRKASLIVVLMVLLLAAVAAVVVFTGQRTDTGVNGVWRTTVSVLGVDVESGTEGWLEYEFKDGQGRLITYVNGEIRSANALSYIVEEDSIIITELNENWEELGAQEYVWSRDGDTLTLSAYRGDLLFERVEREYPAFDGLEGYVYVSGLFYEGADSMKASYSQTEEAKLLKLLASSQVTAKRKSQLVSDERYYVFLYNGEQSVVLTIADGLVNDGSGFVYELSNIDEIMSYIMLLSWREVKSAERITVVDQAFEAVSQSNDMKLILSRGNNAMESVGSFGRIWDAVNAEHFFVYNLQYYDWIKVPEQEVFFDEPAWCVRLTHDDWTLWAYEGTEYVLFDTPAEDTWYRARTEGANFTSVYSVLRSWYDEVEAAAQPEIVIPDEGQSYLEAAAAYLQQSDARRLQYTSGSKHAYIYCKSELVDGDFVRQQTEHMRKQGDIGENEYCFYVKTAFVAENEMAWAQSAAGNTKDYEGNDPDVPEGAYQYDRCGIIELTDDGWRVTHMGTSW